MLARLLFFIAVTHRFVAGLRNTHRIFQSVGNKVNDLPDSNNMLKQFKHAGACFLTGCIMVTMPLQSNAQIPSMDEYNTGSGTVLPGRARVVGKPVATVAADISDTFSVSIAEETLTKIDSYISSEPAKWDEIIRAIKLTPKYNVKNLGFKSSSDLASNFKIKDAQALLVESAREDFAFNLGQLNDLALANREYFFNKADLEQTQMLKDAADLSSSTAVKEGREILTEVHSSFKSLVETLTPL